MDRGDVEIFGREIVHDGYLEVLQTRLRHRLHAGGWSRELTREVIERGHAVAVLPYDAARDEVVMVEQLRIGAVIRGDDAPWLLEIVAGIVEPGEDLVEVARREAMEEAGIELGNTMPILTYYTSPGVLSETIAIFHAEVDARGAGGVHGLAEEGEDIRVVVLDFAAAMAALAEGRVTASPAVIALQWLALNRDELRRAAGAEAPE